VSPQERKLRELLAIRIAGAALYRDDGELQDNSVRPFIDFLRDTPEVIEAKVIDRAMRALETRERRLQDAIEGECFGLAITEAQATKILKYLDKGDKS